LFNNVLKNTHFAVLNSQMFYYCRKFWSTVQLILPTDREDQTDM